MKEILVIGSSNTDLIINVPEIPRPGETVLGGDLLTVQGGKGANQAVAAARSGGRVNFIAAVGNDSYGSQAIKGYKSDGIDTSNIKICNGSPTGVALITVSSGGENAITVAPGANHMLDPFDLQKSIESFHRASLLLIQLEIPYKTVFEGINLAASSNIPVILNPAPAGDIPDDVLKKVSIITPNETEAELLTGVKPASEDSMQQCCNRLHDKGIGKVILTLGAKGAFLSDRESGLYNLVPGFIVDAVDTTAAGDVFNGALAVAICEGIDIHEGIRFAHAAAALSAGKTGAQPSIPFRGEIEELLRR